MAIFGRKRDKGQRAYGEGTSALRQRQFQEAQQLLETAVKCLKEDQDRGILGMAHYRLGQAFWYQQKLEDALCHYEIADKLVEDPSERPALLSRFGTCLSRLGRRREALKVWERALEEARPRGSPVELIHALSMVAQGHRDITGRADVQRTCYEEMLKIASGIELWQEEWIVPIVMDIGGRAVDQRDLQTLEEWRRRVQEPFPVVQGCLLSAPLFGPLADMADTDPLSRRTAVHRHCPRQSEVLSMIEQGIGYVQREA